jgi:hypothetical protein
MELAFGLSSGSMSRIYIESTTTTQADRQVEECTVGVSVSHDDMGAGSGSDMDAGKWKHAALHSSIPDYTAEPVDVEALFQVG